MKSFRKVPSYWRLSSIASRSSAGRIRLFILLISVPLRKKVFGKKPRRLPMSFAGREFAFYARDASDIAVLEEVFLRGEYRLSLREPVREIIDVGSHIGASAIFFKLAYPDAHIACFEPDEGNFKLLVRNTAQFASISCTAAAIATHSGTVRFASHLDSSISGSLIDRGDPQSGARTVEGVVLDEAIERSGGSVDLVKFDIEGAEFDVLSASRSLRSVRSFVGELHFDLMPGKTKDDFYSIFNEFDAEIAPISEKRCIIRAQRNENRLSR